MITYDSGKKIVVVVAILAVQFVLPGLLLSAEPESIVQAQAVLTVSESKRLIAKEL
jgi:hypothetical protein